LEITSKILAVGLSVFVVGDAKSVTFIAFAKF
jgi:hypothetical protein